jgi:hypothetical protein
MFTEQHRSERELSIIQSEEVCSFEFIFKYLKYLLRKSKKKSLKKRGNFPPIACAFVRHLFDISRDQNK